MDDFLPSRAWLRAFLSSPDSWYQIALFAAGATATWVLGRYLRSHLDPMTQPGVVKGMGRTAVRTTALALVPALFWLWLAAGTIVFRKLGFATDVLRPAMLLVGAAAIVRAGVFVLRHSFSPGSRLKAWEGVLTTTIWLLIALHILGWLPFVEQMLDDYALLFGKVRVSLYNVVSFALLIGLLLLVALWISNVVHRRVQRSAVLDASMKLALTKLTTFTLGTLAVLAAMVSAGIDLTTFAVFGGALGVGLGLGLQRVVSNFVSGFIIAFEGSVRPGDWINIGGQRGQVRALHARHAVLHTEDGLDILVPNENLLTSEIVNWSYAGDSKVRLALPVQIGYNDDPEAAMELLVRLARANPRVLADPEPTAVVLGFAEAGVNLELRVWIEDLAYGVGGVRSDLYRRVWREFRDAGISMPYPQYEVRLLNEPPKGR
jgi:small-conductance mechanosensitive channel